MDDQALMEPSTPALDPVDPVRPAAGYIGGKRVLAARIIDRIGAVDHRLYAEPFVGMGGVFPRRRHRPRAEVINDLSRDVSGFFRILQRHYVAFIDHIRHGITSSAEFDRLSRTDPDTLTDIERAARFLYLQRTGFGGKVTGRTFGVSPDRRGGFDLTQLGPLLDALHTRRPVLSSNACPGGPSYSATTGRGPCSILIPPTTARRRSMAKGCSASMILPRWLKSWPQ